MERASNADRARMAFQGFGYAHYVILIGIVIISVGKIREVVGASVPLRDRPPMRRFRMRLLDTPIGA